MGTREIAELLEKQHSNIKISAERLYEAGAIGTLAPQGFTHNNNNYEEYLLSKRDSYVLVAQNSPQFTARLVDRWQYLEDKEQKAPTHSRVPVTLEHAVAAMDIIAKALNASESGKIGMFTKTVSIFDKEIATSIPFYGFDAPTSKKIETPSFSPSSEVVHSLTYLLKEHNKGVGATVANKMLLASGYLSVSTRPSRSKGTKEFWTITEKGLEYGKNAVKHQVENETQPLWYDCKFEELCQHVNIPNA